MARLVVQEQLGPGDPGSPQVLAEHIGARRTEDRFTGFALVGWVHEDGAPGWATGGTCPSIDELLRRTSGRSSQGARIRTAKLASKDKRSSFSLRVGASFGCSPLAQRRDRHLSHFGSTQQTQSEDARSDPRDPSA